MKIVLASSYVPFIHGGGRFIVDWLEEKLREFGHLVERYYLPFEDSPETLLSQIASYRLMDLSDTGDRLIAFRPPAYVLQHPHKVLWFIHHIRVFYDLWGSEWAPEATAANVALREALFRLDTRCLNEAKTIFTNSKAVSERLWQYNAVRSEPLIPPILDPAAFRHEDYGDEVVVISRIEPHKRQGLLIEAMRHVKTPVQLRLCGRASRLEYADQVRRQIIATGVGDCVVFEDRWISENEKAARLATALAVAYAPLDEDGMGYPSVEAAHARKPLITATDSGGVLELVIDAYNGFVVEPDPRALAEAMDRLYRDRDLAKRMGDANFARLSTLAVGWPHVIEKLTA